MSPTMSRQSEAATPAMHTEAAKTRSLDMAFLVEADHLRQLENVLREIGDSVEYQVTFSDGHALQFHSMEDVLKQPNSQARAIVSLIAGVTGQSRQSAYVVLQDRPATSSPVLFSGDKDSNSPSVEYTINGTQKNVIYVGDKLDEWASGIRQWYSMFERGLPALLLFAAIVVGPIWLGDKFLAKLFSQEFLKTHDWLSITLVIGFWTGTYWTFKLFPRATFAIGQGMQRHQLFVYLRSSIVGAFILSVVASIFANWLT